MASTTYDPMEHGARCDRCPLRGESRVVPPASGRKVRLAVVGEAPGRREVFEGIPFVGPSGRVFDEVLDETPFTRDDLHVTNTLLCRYDDEKHVPTAVACCAPRLAKELSKLPKSTPILALGAVSLKPLLGRGGILKARGFVWKTPEISPTQLRAAEKKHKNAQAESTKTSTWESLSLLRCRALLAGRVVIPSVHPAFLLRGADAWRPVFAVDVNRAVEWATKGPLELEEIGPYVETSDVRVVRKHLSRMSSTIDVDVETDGAEPLVTKLTCVGVCDVDDVSKAVIIMPPEDLPAGRRRDIWWKRAVGPVLAEALRKRTVVTHNGPIFDELVLERYGVKYSKNEDTLYAHHAFASHLPKSLSHVASIYTTASPWKILSRSKSKNAEEKGFGVADEDLAQYNAADVRLDALAWRRMQPDLQDEMTVYRHDMAMAKLCQEMTRTGLLVDTPRRDELAKKLRYRAAALLGEMRQLLRRRRFDPAKLAHIRQALYSQLKAPTWLAPPTPTGMPSTAATVLEALKESGTRSGKLADKILRWRSAKDVLGEYIEGPLIHNDGRIHASWKNYGTVSGRPATRNPNVLNWPRYNKQCDDAYEEHVRDIIVAPYGKVFVYFDLSQAEMYMAAHLASDDAFIATCRSGDVHLGNARVVFPFAAEELKDPKGAGKTYRDIAKNCGFGITYYAGADKIFMFLQSKGFHEVTMADAQAIYDRLHESYSRYYEYVEENYQSVRRHGFMRTPLLGRIRWLGWYPKITEVANFPVQSGVADVMNARLMELDKRKPKSCRLLIYAYDAAIYECPVREADLMEKLVKETWGKPIVLPHNDLRWVQPIDMKRGDRWSQF